MHDLIREMGQEIIREKSINELGGYSHLWNVDNIRKILKDNTVSIKQKKILL